MDQLTSSPDEVLQSKLVQLREKRVLLNQLIRSLEHYAEMEAKAPSVVVDETVVGIAHSRSRKSERTGNSLQF